MNEDAYSKEMIDLMQKGIADSLKRIESKQDATNAHLKELNSKVAKNVQKIEKARADLEELEQIHVGRDDTKKKLYWLVVSNSLSLVVGLVSAFLIANLIA